MNMNQLGVSQSSVRTPKLLIQIWIDIIDNEEIDVENSGIDNSKENAMNLLIDLFGSINEARMYLDKLNQIT